MSKLQSSQGIPPARWSRSLFALLVGAICLWVLSLPVFPSQDGPAHKYYAGVLSRLLSGDSFSHAYLVRFPIPPYASQDYLLAYASRVMDINLAEKLFVCGVILLTAYGIRFCCNSMGPAGGWVSLLVMPLLLHWPLMMGFMNYAFGLGLMFLAFGLWLYRDRNRPRTGWWFAYVSTLVVLTFTHPVALMMLFLLCVYDALMGFFFRKNISGNLSFKRTILPLLLIGCAMAYPLLCTDRSRSTAEVKHSIFQFRSYLSEAVLYGLTPFYRHASLLSPAGIYRICLYLLLLVALFIGARGLADRWRNRSLERTDFMWLASVLSLLLIPLMPNSVNSGVDFFVRMLVVAWILALFSACRISVTQKTALWISLASIALTVTLLVPANQLCRPVANRLAALDHLKLPERAHGFIMVLPAEKATSVWTNTGLGFSPYLWSAMVPALRASDVIMNSPWLDASYLSTKPGEDPDLLYNIVGTVEARNNIDKHDGDLKGFPEEQRNTALRAADFIFALPESTEQTDLTSELGHEAGAFHCGRHSWYLYCLPTPQRDRLVQP